MEKETEQTEDQRQEMSPELHLQIVAIGACSVLRRVGEEGWADVLSNAVAKCSRPAPPGGAQ